MKFKKSWKLFSGLVATTVALSASVPLAIALSSCSNEKQDHVPYSYDKQNKTLNVNSFSLFGDNNILYGFQLIKMGNYPEKGIENYNLKTQLNRLLKPEFGDNFISESQNVTQTSVAADGYNLIIPVTDTSMIRSDVQSPVKPLEKIVISFPKLSDTDLQAIPTVYSSSRISFKGMTMYEVKQLPDEDIIAGVGTNLIPKVALFSNEDPVEDGDCLKYFLFIPNVGLSQLIIDFAKIEVPQVTPSNIIASSNLANNWADIINWTPTLPSSINYAVMDNPTGLVSANQKTFISSYDKALHGEILLNTFNKVYYLQSPVKTNSLVLNKEVLELDFAYFIKNLVGDLIRSWKNQNILNSNVYTGVEIQVDNDKFNGAVGVQFKNTSGLSQVIELPYLSNSITVHNNEVVSLVFEFTNSSLQPGLKANPKNKYQAYLLPEFNNFTVKVSVNNQIREIAKTNQFKRIFDYSLATKTLVSNVLDSSNYLTEIQKIQEAYNAEFGTQKSPNQDFYINAIRQDVQNKIQSTGQVILGIQNIALNWAKNPTILEFLQSLSLEMNRIFTAIVGQSDLVDALTSIFSKQPIASFLFFNLQSIVDLIRSFATPSTAETINGIANTIEQLVIGNPNLESMEEWLSTLQSAYASLEQMFKNDDEIQPLLPLMKHVLDTISTNPSLIQFVFMNLNAIFTIGQDYQEPVVKAIAKGLQEYMNGLLAFANKTNSQSQKNVRTSVTNDPNDLVKYNSIRVMDPFIYPNTKDSGYKSLLTCIGNAWKTVKPDDKTADTLIKIGQVLEILQFKNINQKTLSDAVEQLFNNVKINLKENDSIKPNDETTTTNLFSAYSNYLIVNEELNDKSLDFKLSFEKPIILEFSKIANLLNSLDYKEILNLIPDLDEKIKNIIDKVLGSLKLGNLIFPNTLYINEKNSIIFQYSLDRLNINPIIKNENLNWKFDTKLNKTVNLSQSFLGKKEKNEPLGKIRKSSWGTLLGTVLGPIILNAIKKAYPDLPPYVYGLIENLNISKLFALLIENIYQNTKTTTQEITTKSKSNIKFENFNANMALDGVSADLVNQPSGMSDLITFLTNEIKTKVTWTTPSSKNPGFITTPTLQWNKSSNFDQDLAKYLLVSEMFNQQDSFVNYATSLSGYKLSDGLKIFTFYTFTINFSVPTLVKDLNGNYSVKNSISFQIKIVEDQKPTSQSRNY